MPSGRTHETIAVIASPPLAAATGGLLVQLGHPPLEALFGASLLTATHLAATRWLSPDLDLGSARGAEQWGVLAPIWLPYERAIPHRHWLSHSGASALLRLAYLYIALNCVLVLIGLLIFAQAALIGLLIGETPSGREVVLWLLANYVVVSSAGARLALEYPAFALALAGGAVASDVVHTATDHLDTWRKRRRIRALRVVPMVERMLRRHRSARRRPARRKSPSSGNRR